MGIAVQGVTPATPAAVVVLDDVARLHGDPVGGVGDPVRVVGVGPQHHGVGLTRPTPGDAGHRVLHADHVGVDVAGDPDLLAVVAAAEASPLARPARVGPVVPAPLDVGEQALVDLRRGLPQVAEAGGLAAPGIHALGRVAPSGVHLGRVVGEGLAGAGVDAPDDGGDAGLVGLGHGPLGQHVLHGDGDDLADVGAGVVGAGRHRLARGRVEDAARRDDQLQGVEEPLVLGDLRVHHRGDLGDGVAPGVAVGGPGLDLVPGVTAGVVDHQTVAVDGDLHVEVDVGVAQRIVVDVGIALVAAVGPGRDLLTEASGGVVDHVVDRLLDGGHRVAVDHRPETLGGHLRGAHLGPEITDVVGQAVVHRQRVEDVAALFAPVDDLDHRPAGAFAPDVGGGDVVAPGDRAAGVAVVALDGADQDHPAGAVGLGAVDGGEDVVVGEVAAAVVRVVGHEDVTLPELLGAEEVEGEAHRQGAGEHELGDPHRQGGEPALGVEHGGVALVGLVEDGGGRRTGDVLGHLEADGLHRVADDLGGDGIDRGLGRQTAPALGKADEVDVGHVTGSPWRTKLTLVSGSVHAPARDRDRLTAGRAGS